MRTSLLQALKPMKLHLFHWQNLIKNRLQLRIRLSISKMTILDANLYYMLNPISLIFTHSTKVKKVLGNSQKTLRKGLIFPRKTYF